MKYLSFFICLVLLCFVYRATAMTKAEIHRQQVREALSDMMAEADFDLDLNGFEAQVVQHHQKSIPKEILESIGVYLKFYFFIIFQICILIFFFFF